MTAARELTREGILEARRFLAAVREQPRASAEPPDALLFQPPFSRPLVDAPEVELRTFGSRREAADYLGERLQHIQHRIVDNAGFWSWLGMFYFASTAPRDDQGQPKLSPLDETFVVHHEEQQSYQRRYRHYLWSAWRLQQQHGDEADFLLDQPLHAFGDIADRVFSYNRIFNSAGIVTLILDLYTSGGRQKRNFSRSRGGLRHLIRVLDQLERTYDVYGMSGDQLLRILPPDFDVWRSVEGAQS